MRQLHSIITLPLILLSALATHIWPFLLLTYKWLEPPSYYSLQVMRPLFATRIRVLKNQLYCAKHKQTRWSAMQAWPAH